MSVVSSIENWFSTKWKWLLFIAAVQTVSHFAYLKLPAVGNHVWRQCNTLAIARNYAEEDMRIWLPRIDKRYNTPGTTGPSFTLYEYGLACIYKEFGFSEEIHRWYSLGISIITLFGIFYLVWSFKKDLLLAGCSALALIAIPEFYYHSINAIPDLLALGLMIWAWIWCRKWLAMPTFMNAALAVGLTALAGMVKLQFLIIGIPVGLEFIVSGAWKSKRNQVSAANMVLIVAGICYAWYSWAHHLTFEFWLNEFVHDIRLPDSGAEFFRLLWTNLILDIPETWVGYALLPGFVAGIIFLAKDKLLRWYLMLTFDGLFVVYLLLQKQFEQHGYYTLFFAPFVAIAAAYGYSRLFKNRLVLLVLFFLLATTWAWIRMKNNWSPKGLRVPGELMASENRLKVMKNSDKSVRYIVGPDQSGCVYFYYLHAKGFPWYNENDAQTEMARFVRDGARGMITNRPDLLEKNYSDSLYWEETARVGAFRWYRIGLKRQ